MHHADLFEIEQVLFAPQAATVAAEVAVLLDDAVTGDDDGNGVSAVGQPHGPAGCRLPDVGGELFIAPGASAGDVPQAVPHFLLKDGTDRLERHFESIELVSEVVSQFFHALLEDAMAAPVWAVIDEQFIGGAYRDGARRTRGVTWFTQFAARTVVLAHAAQFCGLRVHIAAGVDRQVAEAWQVAMRNAYEPDAQAKVRQQQRDWLAKRDGACGTAA